MNRIGAHFTCLILLVGLCFIAFCGQRVESGPGDGSNPAVSATIDLLSFSPAMTEQEWKSAMSPSDGRMVRFVGCFEPALSRIDGDNAHLTLYASEYQYRPDGQVVLAIPSRSRTIAAMIRDVTIDLPSFEAPQPFAVDGILRVGNFMVGKSVRAWATVDVRRCTPIHRIPVGPEEILQQAEIAGVTTIEPSDWEDYSLDLGASGERVRMSPLARTTYLQVALREDNKIRIYRIRPGGFYLKTKATLRIVPGPPTK